MKSLIITLIAFALLAACTPVEQPLTAEEKEEIKTTINDLFDKIAEDVLILNWDGIFSHYKFDENLSFVMDSVITVGGDRIKKMMDEQTGYIKKFINYDLPDLEAIVLDRDLVLTMGSFKETYVTTTDDTLSIKGTFSYLLQLEDTDWKISFVSAMHQMAE